jgi:hypothetical protein
MFSFCTKALMGLPGGFLVMSFSWLAARKGHMKLLSLFYTFLVVINTSADPPVANKSPIFLLNLPETVLFLAHDLFYGSSGAKPVDYHSSRSFLLIYLCRNLSVCFSLLFYKELRWLARKN